MEETDVRLPSMPQQFSRGRSICPKCRENYARATELPADYDPKTYALANASYVLGVFSILLGPLAGIPGIISGVVSLRRIKQGKMPAVGREAAIKGIQLSVGASIIVLCLIGVALPGFFRAAEVNRLRKCRENLAKIEGAKEQYALENNVDPSVKPEWKDLIGATLYLKQIPVCPYGGTYRIGDLNTVPECSCPKPSWMGPPQRRPLTN